MQLLPLFFRLFRCQDKALRHMIFHHIIAGDLLLLGHIVWLCEPPVQGLLADTYAVFLEQHVLPSEMSDNNQHLHSTSTAEVSTIACILRTQI